MMTKLSLFTCLVVTWLFVLSANALGQGPDYAFGRVNQGDGPVCVVDGYVHMHIVDCIAYLNSLHSGNNGVIFSTIPETINGTEFALNNFHGSLILGAVPTNANSCAINPQPTNSDSAASTPNAM